MKYRNLDYSEILTLESQGCDAQNWNDVMVKEDFAPSSVRNVSFRGNIKIGSLNGKISASDGAARRCGIFNCRIAESSIDDNSLISNISLLMNYEIGKNCIVEDVDRMTVEGETAFGAGTEISILNEAGGRDLPLLPELSSQIAYLIVHYKDDKAFQKGLKKLCAKEALKYSGTKGYIGEKVRISSVKEIKNVIVQSHAEVSCSTSLINGIVLSERDAPAYIGRNVIAENFIIHSGSSIDSSAILDNCFVGQAVKIGKQYSAENSAFFSNSELYHGEACSIFAGPYSVSHHKSSLLIAGYFSFYNAGSGTNQSNHMYKLGPVHQGILERGSKTGSFSYILFPSKTGPFSVVLGKHYNNFDASDFPFSYISEENGSSILTPAMNLFSVGTKRDSAKWAKRDKRKSRSKLDNINYDLYSPFITDRMMRASDILSKLYKNTPREVEFVSYKGIQIQRLLLKTCRKYYDLGIDIAIGEKIKQKMESDKINSLKEIANLTVQQEQDSEEERWIDIAGQFISSKDLERIKTKVTDGEFLSLDELNGSLFDFHNNYDSSSWKWYSNLIKDKYAENGTITTDLLMNIMDKWAKSKIKILNMTLKDAEKEFDSSSKIGYGIDGDQDIINKDFENVRGTFNDNSFVLGLKEEIEETLSYLEGLKKQSIQT